VNGDGELSVQAMMAVSAMQCWPSRVGSLVRYRPEAFRGGVPKAPCGAAISVVLITIYSITETVSIIYITCYQSHATLTTRFDVCANGHDGRVYVIITAAHHHCLG